MAKKEKNLEVKEKTTKKKETKKDGIWAKIVLFFKGVKSEWKRVKWPTKKEMIKYSVATIVLIVGCSVFFYVIDVLLAFLHSLGK
ncbi:preprotein translocase SecE subunit [Clostridium sp. CAG:451]|nr:preprotein translocase SecE subunit [Clostridium sp. CAG:451]